MVCVCLCVVPEEFMYNPVSRSYGEPHKRPEVQNATIEFIAPSEYMVGFNSFFDIDPFLGSEHLSASAVSCQ